MRSIVAPHIGGGESTANAGSSALNQHLAPIFQNRFDASINDVFVQAARGGFDNADLAEEASRIRARLDAARETRTQAGHPAAPSGGDQAGGALGGPAPSPAPPADLGGSVGAHAGPAPSPAQPGNDVAGVDSARAADERALLDVTARQAQWRRDRVAESLPARFTAGSALRTTLDGHVDPRDLRPHDAAEATAIAERLAMDLAIGAADLELIATKLDLARHDAAHAPSAATNAAVAGLEQAMDRQQSVVVNLAEAVDSIAGGSITDSDGGAAAARANALLQRSDDPSVDPTLSAEERGMAAVVEAVEENGGDAADIAAVATMHDGVVQEATTGSSPIIDRIKTSVADALIFLMNEDMKRTERRHEAEDKRAERDREFQERLTEQRAVAAREQKRLDELAEARAAAARAAREQAILAATLG